MRQIDPNLIRAYIDGELSPEMAEAVRRAIDSDTELAQRFELEQRLKSAVGQVMAQSPAAPAALREHLEVALSEQATTTATSDHARATPSVVASRRGVLAAMASLLEPIVRPKPMSIGAVLAVLAIAVGSVLFGIFYRPIDSVAPPQGGQGQFVSDPAEYASLEHDRCVQNPAHLKRKVNMCDKVDAAAMLTEHFGVESVTIFDLSEIGYEFIGEGRCNLPEARRSAHLMYERRVEGKSPAKLSIFIAPAGADRPVSRCGATLEAGKWHRFRDDKGCRKRVLISTDDSLVYFLVTCDQDDIGPISEVVGRALLARAR